MVLAALAKDAVQLIRRFPDLEAMSHAASDHFANAAKGQDRFAVALSGGSTPKRLYELLATRSDIDWRKVHLFFGDERYVPPSDPRSNERMVREALVHRIDIPAGNVHTIYSASGWQQSADEYEELIRDFFSGRDHTFDLALQGMGDDGHTASIFPGSPPTPHDRWVVTAPGTTEAPERISLTLDCLAASREVIFLVSGSSKAERLPMVLAGGDFPAAKLAALAKNVQWWIDDAAGRFV